MTIPEAITILRRWLETCESTPMSSNDPVKALKTALEAMHRRDPMKPIDNGTLWCPTCFNDMQDRKPEYCPDCGQAIDWTKGTQT